MFKQALRTGLFAVAGFVLAGMVVVGSLRWIDPITSSVIFQQQFVGEHRSSQRGSFDWRPLRKISKPMTVAVIAAEDQRFLRHYGLDFVELFKTLREGKNRPRGASTITQQVAKNMFLWSARSYPRKFLEAVLAVYIDRVWGKRRVLEMYLNIVQFGPGIYGVENAAQHFFGKSASRLNRHEAARLAAVLPNPNHRAADNPNTQVLNRQTWILRQMQNLDGAELIDNLR